jgi:hypothetical protein
MRYFVSIDWGSDPVQTDEVQILSLTAPRFLNSAVTP